MTPIAGLRNQASRFLSSAGGQRADEKFTLLIRLARQENLWVAFGSFDVGLRQR